MNTARIAQLVWAITLGLYMLWIDAIELSLWGAAFRFACFLYFLAALGCFFDNRACWWMALLYPLIPLYISVPLTCRILFGMAIGTEPYDHPILFVMVLFMIVIGIFPALFIYSHLIADRRRLLQVLRPDAIVEDDRQVNVGPPRRSTPNPYAPPGNTVNVSSAEQRHAREARGGLVARGGSISRAR